MGYPGVEAEIIISFVSTVVLYLLIPPSAYDTVSSPEVSMTVAVTISYQTAQQRILLHSATMGKANKVLLPDKPVDPTSWMIDNDVANFLLLHQKEVLYMCMVSRAIYATVR